MDAFLELSCQYCNKKFSTKRRLDAHVKNKICQVGLLNFLHFKSGTRQLRWLDVKN